MPDQETILKIEMTAQIDIAVGEEIWLYFETNNNIEQVFLDDLGSK